MVLAGLEMACYFAAAERSTRELASSRFLFQGAEGVGAFTGP